MKMLFLLGIVALCAYLYFTQTAQIARDAAAKEEAAAEAAEKATAVASRQTPPPATPAPAPAQAARLPATASVTPASKQGDWMWQKATPDPKKTKR